VCLDSGAHPGTAGPDHENVVRRLHVRGSYTKRPSARGGTVGVRSAIIRQPDPPLGDGVVALRQWRKDDVAVLPGLINGDPEIERWLELMPSPYTRKDAREWVERASEAWRSGQFLPFAVLDAETGQVVGGLGFNSIDGDSASGEIGYWVSAAARGRGLTTRALRLVTRWGFEELGLERVQVRAEVENVASCRVAEKAGYRREGVIRSSRYNPRLGRRMDFVLYSALPGEIEA
jgi:RimJ/RimL family protein N-acetyltransferase